MNRSLKLAIASGIVAIAMAAAGYTPASADAYSAARYKCTPTQKLGPLHYRVTCTIQTAVRNGSLTATTIVVQGPSAAFYESLYNRRASATNCSMKRFQQGLFPVCAGDALSRL